MPGGDAAEAARETGGMLLPGSRFGLPRRGAEATGAEQAQGDKGETHVDFPRSKIGAAPASGYKTRGFFRMASPGYIQAASGGSLTISRSGMATPSRSGLGAFLLLRRKVSADVGCPFFALNTMRLIRSIEQSGRFLKNRADYAPAQASEIQDKLRACDVSFLDSARHFGG